MTRERDEAGTVMPLIIGFFVVVGLLVAVVLDVSAAFLRRQALNSAADAAALAATEGLQGNQVYDGGLGERGRIDSAAARRYVADYMATSGIRQRYPGVGYTVTTDDNTVTVRLAAPLRLPLPVPGVVETARITGTAASIVAVRE